MMRNGISISGLSEFVDEVKQTPSQAHASYAVNVQWQNGTRSRANTLPMQIGAHRVARDFSWTIDEPRQLLGSNHAPNPQEYLLSGLGSCIMVGFAVGASVKGIQLESLEVTVRGELNLAGFFGLADAAQVPFQKISYEITVSGDGNAEDFEDLHQKAVAHSPNAMTIANTVSLEGRLTLQNKDSM